MNPTRNDWNVDVPLTNISIAYQQEGSFVADKVFPTVAVSKKSDKYYVYDKNDWLRAQAEERAPGTESAGSGYRMSTDTYYCEKPAIHKDIDNDDLKEAGKSGSVFDLKRDATEWVAHQLLLKKELKWVNAYFATGVWGTDLTPANLWSDYTNSTPLQDVGVGQATILQNSGRSANTMVVGYSVWQQLKNHPDIVDRYKHTSPDAITPQLVARLFELDNLYVAKAIHATNEEGGTAAYAFAHGKHALLCYVNPRPSLRQPSAGYAFGWTGLGNGRSHRVRQFEIEARDVLRVEGESAYDFKVTGTDLGYLFDDVVA